MKIIMKLAWAVMAGLVLVGTTSPAFAERDDRSRKVDTDGDGYVSQAEFEGTRISEFVDFSEIVTEHDGQLSLAEYREFRKNNPPGGRECNRNDV